MPQGKDWTFRRISRIGKSMINTQTFERLPPLFGRFPSPSLGVIAAPPEVPAIFLGIQMLYAGRNAKKFLFWPNEKELRCAFLDLTWSQPSVNYVRTWGKSENLQDPLFFVLAEVADAENFVRFVEEMKSLDLLFIHGVHGWFSDDMYVYTSLKRLVVQKRINIVINHVLPSVVYGSGTDIFREPLSHAVVKNPEIMSLFDWTWFMASANLASLTAVTKAKPVHIHSDMGYSYYANKIVQTVQQEKVSPHGLFFTGRHAQAPFLGTLELEPSGAF